MVIKWGVNRKLYLILLIASILSVLAILPFALTIQADLLKDLPIPLSLALLASVIQSSILFAILIFVGLKLSKKVGLGIPVLESYATGKKTKVNLKSLSKFSILLGVIVGVSIILVDLLFIKAGVSLVGAVSPPIWQGFLASFYGGIGEEILLRLFFMTLIVWIFSKFTKSKVIENNFIMWSSIIVAAIIFGLGHLPATAAMTALTPLVILRAVILNGIGGVVFGWLYWKKGLESAIIAHFSTDIVLHVLFPLLIS
jgi:membrane protease YdiL (CAAX protease family)